MDECKPLVPGQFARVRPRRVVQRHIRPEHIQHVHHAGQRVGGRGVRRAAGKGLHSSTFQLNPSRF